VVTDKSATSNLCNAGKMGCGKKAGPFGTKEKEKNSKGKRGILPANRSPKRETKGGNKVFHHLGKGKGKSEKKRRRRKKKKKRFGKFLWRAPGVLQGEKTPSWKKRGGGRSARKEG